MKKLSSLLYQSSAIIAGLFGKKRKFMNLGYVGQEAFDIKPSDSSDTHHISLYMRLLNMVPGIQERGKNMSVLELGCGRGGGCYVMKNYYNISNITGIDLSSGNIKIASGLVPGVNFITGNATEFNTEKKYDLVLNLESSHAYSSRLDFFKRVNLVMDQNSFFAFGDLIKKIELEDIESKMKESGLKIVKSETINKEIINSIKENSSKQYPLATRFPVIFPRKLHNFFVTIHSKPFSRLKKEEVLYRLYLLQKA